MKVKQVKVKFKLQFSDIDQDKSWYVNTIHSELAQ